MRGYRCGGARGRPPPEPTQSRRADRRLGSHGCCDSSLVSTQDSRWHTHWVFDQHLRPKTAWLHDWLVASTPIAMLMKTLHFFCLVSVEVGQTRNTAMDWVSFPACSFRLGCRCSRLFNQRRILLRHLVQACHGLIHLTDAVALLARAVRDFTDDVLTPAARCSKSLAWPNLRHEPGGCLIPLFSPRSQDRVFDFLGGGGAALGQAANLAGRRETAALFASASGFNRSVQRQDVGLEGNAVNDTDDVVDALAGATISPYYHLPKQWRYHARQPSRAAGQHWFCPAANRRCSARFRQLVHRRCGFLQAGCGVSVQLDKSMLPLAISVDATEMSRPNGAPRPQSI